MTESDRTARLLDQIRARLGGGDPEAYPGHLADCYEFDVSFLLGERDRLERERDTFATRLNRLDDLVEKAAALTTPNATSYEVVTVCRECGHRNVNEVPPGLPSRLTCGGCGQAYSVEIGWVKP